MDTNQLPHYNYTVQMSNQIPLMDSELSSDELKTHSHANETTKTEHSQSQHQPSQGETRPVHFSPYIQWACDLYANYSANRPPKGRRQRTRNDKNEAILRRGGEGSSGWEEGGTPETTNNPFVSSDSLLPSRQEVSSSSSSATTAAEEPQRLIDLTSLPMYETVSGDDGLHNGSESAAEGISLSNLNDSDGEGGSDMPITPSEVESKGVSGGRAEIEAQQIDVLDELLLDWRDKQKKWHNTPRTPRNGVGSESADEESGADPSSALYWSRSPDIVIQHLNAEDKRTPPPIGIERVFYYLLRPGEPEIEEEDYSGVKDASFEQAFGVSEEHMEWLCGTRAAATNTTTEGNGTRVPEGGSIQGNNEDGINNGDGGGADGTRSTRST